MNTQTTLGIRSTARRTDDRRAIPAQTKTTAATAIVLPLIAHLAAEHAAVLDKWKRKFALDLRWHRAVTVQR